MAFPVPDWKEFSAFLSVMTLFGKSLAKPWLNLRARFQQWRIRPTKKVLLAQNTRSQTQISELQAQIFTLQEQVQHFQAKVNISPQEPQVARLPDLQEKTLIAAADAGAVYQDTLILLIGVHPVTSQFHLQELISAGYLLHKDSSAGSYKLSHKGSTYLCLHNLVPPPKPRIIRKPAGGINFTPLASSKPAPRRVNPAPGR